MFFHYTTNQDFEAYLAQLAECFGYQYKTQLINAIFQNDVLTLHVKNREKTVPQSTLFRPNSQQLLHLNDTLHSGWLRSVNSGFNPKDFDNAEALAQAAQSLTVNDQAFLPTYLHLLNDALIKSDFEQVNHTPQPLDKNSAFINDHFSEIDKALASKSRRTKRRITIYNEQAFHRSMSQFLPFALTNAQKEAVSIINIAHFQIDTLPLEVKEKHTLIQGLNQLKSTFSNQTSMTQLEKLASLVKSARFAVINNEFNSAPTTTHQVMSELNQAIKHCHISPDREEIIRLMQQVKLAALTLQKSLTH
jgi:RecG-like helicase